MTAESIIEHLAESLDECDCGEKEVEYKELYETAYGSMITRELADMWVHAMDVTDGSDREHGQKWSMEQTTEYGNKVSMDWTKHSKCDFYIVMNMVYSDNFKTAKAVSMQDDPMFFARLSKDWLCDSDAGENKLYNYYFNVII